jgi:hypothetical protein
VEVACGQPCLRAQEVLLTSECVTAIAETTIGTQLAALAAITPPHGDGNTNRCNRPSNTTSPRSIGSGGAGQRGHDPTAEPLARRSPTSRSELPCSIAAEHRHVTEEQQSRIRTGMHASALLLLLWVWGLVLMPQCSGAGSPWQVCWRHRRVRWCHRGSTAARPRDRTPGRD